MNLYRAVDKQGLTVDFLLSERGGIEAAKRFFTRAVNRYGAPEKITLDGYAATHKAVRELKQSTILPVGVCVGTSKYLNDLIEQDHRRVKQRIYPMLGFKRFKNAAISLNTPSFNLRLIGSLPYICRFSPEYPVSGIPVRGQKY